MDKCNIFLFVRSKGTFTLRVYKVAVPDKYEEDPLIANTYFNYNLTVKKLEIYSELKPAVHSSHSSFACSGGYIYVFGGKQDGLKIEYMRPGLFVPDVYRLDITAASDSNNMDWELCGRMKVGRVHPGVVVHYNKCYIFGGVLKDKSYAEVYDLESGKSEELPDPARHRLSTKVMLAESNGDPYVVVGSLQRDYLMLYHISTKYWQFFHDCDSALMNSGHPIFVELNGAKIIFTYFKYKLHAYTLPGEEHFQAVIEGMDEGFMDLYIATPSLIHLQENTLCLVHVDGETYSIGGDEGKNVVIHVTRFDVFFEENRGIPKMQARVRGKMNYIIEGNIYYEGAVRSTRSTSTKKKDTRTITDILGQNIPKNTV